MSTSTSAEWSHYQPNLNDIAPPMSALLSEYSHIPPGPNQSTQINHILTVREPVYKAHPYACIGRFRFLALDLSTSDLYSSYILPKMTKASTSTPQPIFLDLGTCFGQDMRKLIHDGAPATAVYGSDIIPAYIDAGYALFKDEDRLPRSQFFYPVDIFDTDPASNSLLKGLADKVDIVHATGFFHLFPLESQKVIARQCLRLLRKPKPSTTTTAAAGTECLILGKQVGNIDPQERLLGGDRSRPAFRHNEASWRAMWEEVVDETEFRSAVKKVQVNVILHDRHMLLCDGGSQDGQGQLPGGSRWMEWWVKVWF